MEFYNDAKIYFKRHNQVRTNPITHGIYNVTSFIVNGDTIPPLITDSLRWQKVLFNDVNNAGYVMSYDTVFRRRLDRGFFSYSIDTTKHEIQFMKSQNGDSEPYSSFLMKYELPDSNTIHLRGVIRKDSVLVVLKNTYHHFILIDTKMQWLKEDGWYNKFFEKVIGDGKKDMLTPMLCAIGVRGKASFNCCNFFLSQVSQGSRRNFLSLPSGTT
jgi:hypothetical protein